MKTIGIIGGLSAESTNHYIELINDMVRAELGGNNSAELVVRYVNFQTYCDLQKADEWDLSGQMLAKEAGTLKSAGADFIILATNTMHIVAPQIEAELGETPFIHLADATADEALDKKFNKVAFIGTIYSMEMDFYLERLRQKGLDPITPDSSDERQKINQIIFDELTKGVITDESREYYQQAIQRLKDRGAEAVILGCTEIGLLIDEENSPLPVLDTTYIHARRAVDLALSKTDSPQGPAR